MNYPYCEGFSDEQEQERTFEFMTPPEVMEELGIGHNTFYRLVNSGELPAFRIGKLWRVKRTSLEQWKS